MMGTATKSVFETLNNINVNSKTEKKNNLTYLSWAWAWGEVKKIYPNAAYTVYERETEYGPVNYFTDGRTCWVKTGLTINGLEHIEELPVMDYANRSILLDNVKSTDVNKAIQRSLTKAAARHGLGLYIYAGEDLPEEEAKAAEQPINRSVSAKAPEPVPVKIETSATVPELPKNVDPAPSPVQIFLLKAMKELREARGISAGANNKLFKEHREYLVSEGFAPDKKLEEYTLEEAEALIRDMKEKFPVDEAVKK